MRVVIADDEPLLRFHLQKALANVWPEADIIAQAANGEEALALIAELTPDVAFLDIKMPGLTGLEVALSVSQQELSTRIVFLTAYDEFAVDAFDRGAVDYLLKPLDENRLLKTVERLQRERLNSNRQSNPDLSSLVELVNQRQSTQSLTWLNVQRGEVVKVVAVSDVLFFRAEDKYTTVLTTDGEYLMRMSVKQLEERLDKQQFWRIHRSTLVNMSRVDRAERNDSGSFEVFVEGHDKPLAVSRARQHLFKAQ